jgi:hypothetical protein
VLRPDSVREITMDPIIPWCCCKADQDIAIMENSTTLKNTTQSKEVVCDFSSVGVCPGLYIWSVSGSICSTWCFSSASIDEALRLDGVGFCPLYCPSYRSRILLTRTSLKAKFRNDFVIAQTSIVCGRCDHRRYTSL